MTETSCKYCGLVIKRAHDTGNTSCFGCKIKLRRKIMYNTCSCGKLKSRNAKVCIKCKYPSKGKLSTNTTPMDDEKEVVPEETPKEEVPEEATEDSEEESTK